MRSPLLFRPFEDGSLAMPGNGAHVLIIGAGTPVPPVGFAARARFVQPFRPEFLSLRRGGQCVEPVLGDAGFDLGLVSAGRHRGQNEAWLARAIEHVKPGGLVVAAGSNSDGIGSLRRRAAGSVPLEGHLSKHHGVAFWFRNGPEAAAFARSVRVAEAGRPLVEGRFRAAPGMFSADRIDPGSRLLLESLPADLAGTVADFCAGWGYLSVEVAARFPAIAALDLYEADHASLEAARNNMAALAPGTPAVFHWTDLASEPLAGRYDAVVMNPPFHLGRAAEPALGEAMVRAAAAALKKGGRLYLVANRGLPYEATLRGSFSSMGEIVRGSTFKVLCGTR